MKNKINLQRREGRREEGRKERKIESDKDIMRRGENKHREYEKKIRKGKAEARPKLKLKLMNRCCDWYENKE